MSTNLEEKFQAAVDIVQKLPKEGLILLIFLKDYFKGPLQTSNDQKLKFYSLFKQSTIGNVNTDRPGIFSLVERKKWYLYIFLDLFFIWGF